ncbi:MAG: glycosyltransferase family 2 protein, partial [Candidatus Nanopelagicaceae bacterium]
MILDQDVASSRQWAHRAPEGWHRSLVRYYQAPDYSTANKPAIKTKVIVPVHNEQRSLPSFLNALLTADLSTESAISFLFITNACEDQSPAIIRQFLGSIDRQADMIQTPPIVTDPAVEPEIFEARIGNTSLQHINTSTRGKANALRLGNELAVQSGNPIALSVDANVYPEANALGEIYQTAVEHIEDDATDRTVLFYGDSQRVFRPSLYSRLVLSHMRQPKPDGEVRDLKGANGWTLGWHTDWFTTVQDDIQVAVEDYAMSAMARSRGNHTLKVSDAQIWGYKGSTLVDDFQERSRAMRGMLQLINQDPVMASWVENDNAYMRTFTNRSKDLAKRIQASPMRAPLLLGNFVLF